MKFIVLVVSCLVGWAAGGGDTFGDFEYVENFEQQTTDFGGEFSISFNPADLPSVTEDIQPVGLNFETTSKLQPADDIDITSNFRKIAGDNSFPIVNRPPKCKWGNFGKLFNPSNRFGSCNLECSANDKKVRYMVDRWFVGGRYVCCCTPKGENV